MRPANEENLTRLCRAAVNRGDLTAAELLGAQLDKLCRRTLPALVDAALGYAAHGLHVFPLRPGGKQPLPRSRGCLDAGTDPFRIAEWWQRTPQANVGIATGYLIDVIDVDGAVGVREWARLVEAGTLPTILGTVSTPRSGGNHLYVEATGDGNGAALWPGIDYRGLGGYVVAPPSVGPDDVRYHWRSPLQLHQGLAA